MIENMEITKQLSPIRSWLSAKGKIDPNSTDLVDQVLCRIQKRLNKYSELFGACSRQLSVNTMSGDDHKPILVSIGPNNLDIINPDQMEVHKLKYLKDYVKRVDMKVEELLRANFQGFKQITRVDGEFQRWRDHDDVFVEMCILDGCFIVELFLKYCNKRVKIHRSAVRRVNDPLLKSEESVMNALRRDLIRPYNQLPFEVLDILCKFAHTAFQLKWDIQDHYDDIIDLALRFLRGIVPNQELNRTPLHLEHKKTDLLGIVYDGLNWPDMPSNLDRDDKRIKVKSATELEEFGVEFKLMVEADNFINMKFNKGVLEISRLCIGYSTPYSIKVLLWYEQHHRQHKYLNNYLWFMNNLVKSPSDVQLLRQKEIIESISLVDDDTIYKFLKNLCESITSPPTKFNYIEVCKDLNSHCKHRRYSWMVKLKKDYFNSPWAVISFFAASLLLILTIVQTVFSVAEYYKRG